MFVKVWSIWEDPAGERPESAVAGSAAHGKKHIGV
jgi:hypothetical protein